MKDKNSATQEQPQNDAQEEEKKKRRLLRSDILDAVADLIDAVVVGSTDPARVSPDRTDGMREYHD